MLDRINLWETSLYQRHIVLIMKANLQGWRIGEAYQGFKETKPPRGWLSLENHVGVIRISCQLFYDVFRAFQRLGVSSVICYKTNDIIHISQEAKQLVAVWDAVEFTVIID